MKEKRDLTLAKSLVVFMFLAAMAGLTVVLMKVSHCSTSIFSRVETPSSLGSNEAKYNEMVLVPEITSPLEIFKVGSCKRKRKRKKKIRKRRKRKKKEKEKERNEERKKKKKRRMNEVERLSAKGFSSYIIRASRQLSDCQLHLVTQVSHKHLKILTLAIFNLKFHD